MPKMVKIGEFLKIWRFWSKSVTRLAKLKKIKCNILIGQKLIKNAKIGLFWRGFENINLWSNSITRLAKIKNSKTIFWVDKSWSKMPKIKKWSLPSNRVARELSLKRKKKLVENSKIQIRHFSWFSNNVKLLPFRRINNFQFWCVFLLSPQSRRRLSYFPTFSNFL